MSEVQIITDSTGDLSSEILIKKNIAVIPLYVVFEENTYRDGVDINPKELFKKVDETKELPKTSAPTPADFHNIFRPYIETEKSIVYIGLSSNLSSTIQNAKIAAAEFPKDRIHIVDSLNLSAGIGLLALQAVDYAAKGLSAKEIAVEIKETIPKMKSWFMIDTMDYLKKGGRCSSIQSFIGNILKIRPLLKVIDGKIILHQKIRGKKEKTLKAFCEEVLCHKDKMNLNRVVVIHALAEEDALYLKNSLQQALAIKEIVFLEAGCVISSHCGPKTVGIMYALK
ncbi:EDD domain protein, DegV family [Natronincola peptidivorans]|uniref:EDD domain protein, DegV family n=1 Tax=Natronincola peptidivorans TaxID=426128 RepID=A0A1I0DIR5_9FIRM|nr:DegV family protein [Natronincola peptidivorans]SET32325.1 EDD domain protein, DegV family [Natronincola peptidivorans]